MKHLMETNKMITPIQKIKSVYYKMDEAQFHHWLATHLKDLEQDEIALVSKCIKNGGEYVKNEHGRWVHKHDPDSFYEENCK